MSRARRFNILFLSILLLLAEKPALAGEDSDPGKGLMIAGATTFGVTYLSTVIVASTVQNSYGSNFIPVVGPFITLTQPSLAPAYTPLLITSGILQTAGLGLFVAGLLTKASHPSGAKQERLTITPLVTPSALAAVMTFGL